VPFIRTKPLNGVVAEVAKPEFTFSSFIDASYGDRLESWYNAHSNLRPWLVRLRNQWHYLVFNTIHAPDIVVGKKEYLFESIYLKEHSGLNYRGADSVAAITRQLAAINDSLASKGVKLLVVIAPGKGSFYEEYLPEGYTPAVNTNYKEYKKMLSASGISYVDCNSWFLEMKNKAQFPLYPKHGIHWSNYGGLLAADSVLKKSAAITGKDFGSFSFSKIKLEHNARFWDDADLWNLLNVFYRWDDGEVNYAYPELKYRTAKEKPDVLIIGDSFYWTWFYNKIPLHLFDPCSNYWYYNAQAYGTDPSAPVEVDALNYREELEKRDIVILLSTEGNMSLFPFGFTEKVSKIYHIKN